MPFLVVLHRMLSEIMYHYRAETTPGRFPLLDGHWPPIPLLQQADVALQSIKNAFHGGRTVGGLRDVFCEAVASYEALVEDAAKDQARIETDEAAVPAEVWRSFIVESYGAYRCKGYFNGTSGRTSAWQVLSDTNCLKHIRPRALSAVIKEALGQKLRFEEPLHHDEGFFHEVPFSESCQQIAETFQLYSGRESTVAIISGLSDEIWGSVPLPSELGRDLSVDEMLLHWLAHDVLTRGVDDSWHPAWAPGSVTKEQHATLLATRMYWKGWRSEQGLDMILGTETDWEPYDAAALLSMAFECAGVGVQDMWTIWSSLSNSVTAEVAWALADHWIGSSARSAFAFSAALNRIPQEWREQLMECAPVDRRQWLQRAVSMFAGRLFLSVDDDERSEDSDMQSDNPSE
jgi:hypothetical protein